MPESENSIQRVTPLSELGSATNKPKPPLRRSPVASKVATVAKSKAATPAVPLPATVAPSVPEQSKGGKSTSVYFSNAAHLEYLDKLRESFPKASVSSVMSQLLAAFVKAAKERTDSNNQVQMEKIRIFI